MSKREIQENLFEGTDLFNTFAAMQQERLDYEAESEATPFKTVTIRVSPLEVALVDELAGEFGVSRQRILSRIIEDGVIQAIHGAASPFTDPGKYIEGMYKRASDRVNAESKKRDSK